MALAGCTGNGGGGGTEGGSGGTQSGGSGGTESGGSTSSGGQEMQHISLTAPAAPWTAAVGKYMQEEKVLDDLLNSAGYSYEMKITYGGPPLFASGKTDIAGLGATEASIMAATRKFNVVIPGQTYVANGDLAVRPGSKYDPDKVGGIDQAMQNIADSGTFGIGGWEGGDVKIFSVLFPDAFDLQFKQDGGDFKVNSTGDYSTLPKLIVKGDLDVGDILMSLNGFPNFLADPPKLKSLAFVPDLMRDNGFNADAFGGIVARKQFADQNGDAISAYVKAWQKGIDWFKSNPVAATKRYQDLFPGLKTDKQINWITDFALGKTSVGDTPVFYDPVALDDQWISRQKKFLAKAVDRGVVPSGWSDYVEFRKM